MKYKLAIGLTSEELEEAVSKLLELGYRPQGGAHVSGVWSHWEGHHGFESETHYTYAQAMVLPTDFERAKSSES